jgi:hypothetical protein
LKQTGYVRPPGGEHSVFDEILLDTAYDGLFIPEGMGSRDGARRSFWRSEKAHRRCEKTFEKEGLMKLNSVEEEILRFAIRKGSGRGSLLPDDGGSVKPGIKNFWKSWPEEEGHRKKLEHFDRKKIERMTVKETKGLGISEWMEDTPFSSDMNYADLLRLAIKNEERSQQLYASTAQRVTEPTLKKLLLVLAQEESTHKERLEKLYDKDVLEWF